MLFLNILRLIELKIIQICQTGKSNPFLFPADNDFSLTQSVSLIQQTTHVNEYNRAWTDALFVT